MKLHDLRPNTRNPRVIDPEAMANLKASIQRDPEFMALRPIVHHLGDILGGNMRWRACLELGMEEIPDCWAVEARSLTPEQAKRFVVVDNSPDGMAGEWLWDVLAANYQVPELEEVGLDGPGLGNRDLSGVFGTEDQRGDPRKVTRTCPECGHSWEV